MIWPWDLLNTALVVPGGDELAGPFWTGGVAVGVAVGIACFQQLQVISEHLKAHTEHSGMEKRSEIAVSSSCCKESLIHQLQAVRPVLKTCSPPLKTDYIQLTITNWRVPVRLNFNYYPLISFCCAGQSEDYMYRNWPLPHNVSCPPTSSSPPLPLLFLHRHPLQSDSLTSTSQPLMLLEDTLGRCNISQTGEH